MMSVNNNNNMDLTLALGYSDHTVQTKLNNDSGAGVNAGSGLHIFAAPDPLSELVWTPQKGLSLKCADNSLANKKPFLLWNVAPSNEVPTPPEIIRFNSISDEKDIGKGSTGGMEKINPAEVVGNVDTNQNKEHQPKNEEKDLSLLQNIQMTGEDESGENRAGNGEQQTPKSLLQVAGPKFDPAMTKPVALERGEVAASSYSRNEEITGDTKLLGLGVATTLAKTMPDSRKPCPIVASVPDSILQQESDKKVAVTVKEERSKRKMQSSTTGAPLQKMELTAENDMENSIIKEVSVQNEARLLRNNSVPLEASPTLIKISPRKRKGKGKALSDGDNSDSKMSSNEEGSDESVESCNSTRMFPESKNLENFEQPLFLRSKRVKKQMQRNAAPTSTVGHGSSFLTWISNMVNSLSKPSQEEVPSLALALAHSNLGHESNHYGISTCEKNHNIWSTLAIPEIRISKDDNSAGESKDVLLDDKMIIEVSPTICPWENDESDEQFFMSNDKINTSALAWEACKSTSAENKASGSLACRKAKKGGCSSCSMCMLRTGNGESSIPSPHSENKTIKNVPDRSSIQSLWITRFSARDPSITLNLADCRDNGDETTNCAKSNPNAQITSEFLTYHKGSELKVSSTEEPGNDTLKDMPSYALNADASIGFDNSHKLNPIIPFPKFKSSEAMTCLFARRLDAFKHNIPPDARNEATCTKAICLFCGRSGHDLRNCSEATESEQENLLRNIGSYDWNENSHSLCIRCLQLDHWATTCPMVSSGRQYWREHGNSCINHNSNNNLQLCSGDASGPNFLAKEEGTYNIIVNHIACCKEKSGIVTDSNNLVQNPESISVERTVRSSDVPENIASNSGENVSKGISVLPLSIFSSKETASVPKGAFDAIRRLRLSRGDIIKWLDSNASLSHLDGFFLRLRLGRWEGALGGTSYYIARIAGSQREYSAKDSKKCISVSICGITCSVGSEYVSNHDFLEDELMAWWCKTSESGGQVPSEDELRLKVEKRMKLGF